jgi:hypothetical protein
MLVKKKGKVVGKEGKKRKKRKKKHAAIEFWGQIELW